MYAKKLEDLRKSSQFIHKASFSAKTIIKVVIIESDEVIRESYSYLINAADGYSVRNAYPSFEKAIKTLPADDPDVILMDIKLPEISGIDAIPFIKKALPKVNILVLSVYDSESMVFKALCNGASGYLTKNTAFESILDSIRDVFEGGGPMSSKIAGLVIRSFQRNLHSPLTKRESEILTLISQGKSRSRIAEELFIELGTVKTHIRNIYSRLEVNSREGALTVAKNLKLI
jgi:DNA-binding NarL/FixJ family response regulator